MIIKLTKRLLTFAIILGITILSPGIAMATPDQFFPPTILANSEIVAFSDVDLTPQERQKIQGVSQRRNKEIQEVLNLSQRTQLSHALHRGNNIYQALQTLNLQPEQHKLIKAIFELSNLKTKAIFSVKYIKIQNKD